MLRLVSGFHDHPTTTREAVIRSGIGAAGVQVPRRIAVWSARRVKLNAAPPDASPRSTCGGHWAGWSQQSPRYFRIDSSIRASHHFATALAQSAMTQSSKK